MANEKFINDFRQQVEGAIGATVFYSPGSYTWFGEVSQPLSPILKRKFTTGTARNYLLCSLQSQLYRNFYCRGFATRNQREITALSAVQHTPFVKALSAANAGKGYWDTGWQVRTAGEDELVVSRGGLELRARAEDCLVPEGTVITPGMHLRVRFPKELLGISPGFYVALSNTSLPQHCSQPLVRLYWNLTAEGAVHLMQATTHRLNKAQLSFRLKVVNDPASYIRCDAAVLYVLKRDYLAVVDVLSGVYPEIVSCLKELTPAFTKRIAPGVGLAEDPGDDESFGQHRCRLLADGLILAYEQNKKSMHERFQVVADRFAEDGVSLEKPYLNPGCSDDYAFILRPWQHTRFARNGTTMSHPSFSSDVLLTTADGIGCRLIHEAVWYDDKCNWLGLEPLQPNHSAGRTYSALGPELYSGTSGVALFLAELYSSTSGAAARRAALGAIYQALSRVDAVAPRNRLGLYSGWMGIAYGAARVGMVLNEEECLARAAQLLRRCAKESNGEHEFDLIFGKAGAIATIAALRQIFCDPSLVDFAVRLGDELLAATASSSAGYSWRSVHHPHPRNLTGFSHGTAGVAYALLELFNMTGEWKYRRAADLAFHYERCCFDANTGNWPDFRAEPGQRRRCKGPPSFLTAWCHGAAGIALSRLHAYSILADETCRAEAVTALQTTRKMIQAGLRSGAGNYSLCHGLAGNAEVLRHGSQTLEDERADNLGLVRRVAEAGIDAYAQRGHPWPCGAGGPELPSLMLGLAGIGYFYLRVHNPTVPSVLILQRNAFASRPVVPA